MENDTKIIIMIDKNLPIKWNNKLNNLLSSSLHKDKYLIHVWLNDQCIGKNNWLKEYISHDTDTIITTRLDDDDALHPNFCNIIWNDYSKNSNCAITFPFGSYLKIENEKFSEKTKRYTKIGCGLTLIVPISCEYNIYDSNHEFIDKKPYVTKLIKNNNKNMYLVLNHIYGDSYRYELEKGYRSIKGSFKSNYSYIDFDSLDKYFKVELKLNS